jgi:hypothetical protein
MFTVVIVVYSEITAVYINKLCDQNSGNFVYSEITAVYINKLCEQNSGNCVVVERYL